MTRHLPAFKNDLATGSFAPGSGADCFGWRASRQKTSLKRAHRSGVGNVTSVVHARNNHRPGGVVDLDSGTKCSPAHFVRHCRIGAMGRKILTKAVLATIPDMVARDGLGAKEVAQKLGCKISTLKVRCCQARISLLPPGRRLGRPRLETPSE
jgi:hypothetical protein